ncbi:MAG: methyltransferase domain-containing protein [Verrucomicrobiia bacterium]
MATGCLATLSLTASLVGSFLAYDHSNLYQFTWLLPHLRHARHLGNFHAGFDETTAALRHLLPTTQIDTFDFYDPIRHTEPSIRRARAAFPPLANTIAIPTHQIPLPAHSLDSALLFLAAHEIRCPTERANFFRELNRVLQPGAPLIVVEHLRDLPNLLAYSVGAWHFHSKSAWLTTFASANLHLQSTHRFGGLITTFILCKA